MTRLPPVFRWLALAAVADWLVGRTLTRSAIFMPKSPAVIAIYQGLNLVAALAATLTGLLVLCGLAWIAWRERRTLREKTLAFLLVWMVAFTIALLFKPLSGWAAVGYHLLTLAAAAMMAWRLWDKGDGIGRKAALLLPAVALLLGGLYQTSAAVSAALRWPDPPGIVGTFFNLGELFVVLSPVGLWWAGGQGRAGQGETWPYLAAAVPALAFVTAYLLNPAMTGILAIWSIGLTLFLPWPLYAVGIWLATASVVAALRRGDPTGWAILALAAGGYAPQLSTHAFLGLIALWMLAPPAAASELKTGRRIWSTSSASSA